MNPVWLGFLLFVSFGNNVVIHAQQEITSSEYLNSEKNLEEECGEILAGIEKGREFSMDFSVYYGYLMKKVEDNESLNEGCVKNITSVYENSMQTLKSMERIFSNITEEVINIKIWMKGNNTSIDSLKEKRNKLRSIRSNLFHNEMLSILGDLVILERDYIEQCFPNDRHLDVYTQITIGFHTPQEKEDTIRAIRSLCGEITYRIEARRIVMKKDAEFDSYLNKRLEEEKKTMSNECAGNLTSLTGNYTKNKHELLEAMYLVANWEIEETETTWMNSIQGMDELDATTKADKKQSEIISLGDKLSKFDNEFRSTSADVLENRYIYIRALSACLPRETWLEIRDYFSNLYSSMRSYQNLKSIPLEDSRPTY